MAEAPSRVNASDGMHTMDKASRELQFPRRLEPWRSQVALAQVLKVQAAMATAAQRCVKSSYLGVQSSGR